MIELKKALTYEEQVNHLINAHSLEIKDKKIAIDILKRVNYYRLSGYGIGLKTKNNDQFSDGITLEHIYKLYQFDSLFKIKLLHVIEQIEIQLRTQISYHLALKFGPECYLNPENFVPKTFKSGDSILDSIISNFQKECDRQKNKPFVRHHINKYNSRFPVWVAVELFSFGNLTSLYDIMKPEDQMAISSLYSVDPKHLKSWMLALVEIRNICAHYGRLYNMPLKQRPHLFQEHKKYGNWSQIKIFPALLSIKRILESDSLWTEFESNLVSLIEEYQDVIILPFMGFPLEWQKVLTG